MPARLRPAAGGLLAWRWWPAQLGRRVRRRAFSTTVNELTDMPTAAHTGVIQPRAANGNMRPLYSAAHSRFSMMYPAGAPGQARRPAPVHRRRLDSSTASALVLARSVADAHGDADVGGSQHRHVVDPVAEHQHLATFRCAAACRPASLSSGRKPPRASSMPSSAATLATIGELSPDSSSVRQPRALQAASRAGASSRKRSSRHEPGQRPLTIAQQQPLAGVVGHRRASSAPLSAQTKVGLADAQALAVDQPFKAQARRTVGTSSAAAACGRTRGRSGVRNGFPGRRPGPGNGRLSSAPSGRIAAQRQAAFGERAGLVEDHRVDLVQAFQHMAAGHQQAEFMQGAGGGGEGRRGGQGQCARAGGDQHGQHDPEGPATGPAATTTGRWPRRRSASSSKNHCAARSAISARRGFSACARSSKRTMADSRVSWPRACDFHGQRALDVQRAAGDPLADAARLRQVFAGQQRLVDARAAVDDLAHRPAGSHRACTSTVSPTRTSLSRMRSARPSASRRRHEAGSRLTSCAVAAAVRSRARRSR